MCVSYEQIAGKKTSITIIFHVYRHNHSGNEAGSLHFLFNPLITLLDFLVCNLFYDLVHNGLFAVTSQAFTAVNILEIEPS